ncbi:MAG: type I 3-dehydroquinate dehydratase [Prevotellaceae bacterium]|jgi:shikimate dehydrogenase/3-dehydroquinate dehydratase type I|nr:type I 3-dehydroquinate dehydratase [Prevotellaceae bacterium]
MNHKICISITSTSFDESLTAVNHNPLVELRLDLMQTNNEQIKQLLEQSTTSIVTFRDGNASLQKRQEALILAIDNGACHIDIEVEANENYRQTLIQHAKNKGCKVIISYHNFENTPDIKTLKSIIRQCRSMEADIVKLVTTASSTADCSRVLSLYEDEKNLVAFTMGEKGKITRLACLYLGAPFTYASIEEGKEAASGQLAASSMRQMIPLLNPLKTKLFAVVGNPILHSKSPLFFTSAYPTSVDDYAFFRMAAESGEEIVQLFHQLNLSAINVTAPFKMDIVKLADQSSDEVAVLQASNTLVERDSKLQAYNTDVFGVTGSLTAKGIAIKGKNCIVLGAGGAGCAAAYALKNAGANVTIVNRTVEKAKVFAEKIGCGYSGLEELRTMLINTDILASTLTPNTAVVEEQWLRPRLVILDAVYHGSALKQKAINAGCTYIDGNQWLLHQGIYGYKLFTGLEPDSKCMEAALLSPQPMPKHISFIGFMGSGKSSVAPLVAKMLNMPAIDIDSELESRYGETVVRLINNKGEAYFREKEQALLNEILSSQTPTAISCGGGAILHPSLRKQLKTQSIVVCLYATPNQCLKRINVSSRPLLAKCDNPEQAASDLFEERKELYLKTAWLLVNTNGRTIEQVSKIVYDEISMCIGS